MRGRLDLRSVSSSLDFVLRLVFFAVAPFIVGTMSLLLPVTPTIVQFVIMAIAFIAAEALSSIARQSKIVSLLAREQLAFASYYRAYPPKPFLYYVFYPVLFPYWLFVPGARREFVLYKGYTLGSLALLALSQVYSYAVYFRPQLGARAFFSLAIFAFLGELVLVLALLMPMVTTVVAYHQAGARRRLFSLLVVGVVSVAALLASRMRHRDPTVSILARRRLHMRTEAASSTATEAQARALHAAFAELPHARSDVDQDGKVMGAPLEAAHRALAAFYKSDEVPAFDLWLSKSAKQHTLVVYVEGSRTRAPIWLAMDRGGAIYHDPKRLPKGAFVAMKHAAD